MEETYPDFKISFTDVLKLVVTELRMCLWVNLIMGYFKFGCSRKPGKGIDMAVKSPLKTADEAY